MDEQPKPEVIEKKPKNKSLLGNKYFLIACGIVITFWLFSFTNLPLLFGVLPQDLVSVHDFLIKISIVLTIFLFLYIIFSIFSSAKAIEIQEREGNPTILIDPHTQFQTIKTLARTQYNLQLGDCKKISPLMPYQIAGSIASCKFFLFENIDAGKVVSHSLWRQDYIRKIITTMMYRDFYGRNKSSSLWYGEARKDGHTRIEDTFASKKNKDLSNIKHEDYEGSMTE